MFFVTQVTKWDSTRDCDYRIAPLDRGYRDIMLNTNRVNRVLPIDTSKSSFVYFDNPLDSKDMPGYIECNDPANTIKAVMADTTIVKTITLPVYKSNSPTKATTNVVFKISNLAYADRYNASPSDKAWVVYYDLSFARKKVLCPYSLEELAAITSEWGDSQYLLYGDDFASWRKGARGGDFVLDKALTETGFDGIENTDWENVKSVS